MSLTHYDLWISQQDRFEQDIKSQGDLLPYTWFKDCHDELKKLLKLELVSSSPIHEMATLVR